MSVQIHPHARTRMLERGVTEQETVAAVEGGECFPARLGRMAFRRNFVYNTVWRGRFYRTKQVEAIAVKEQEDWVVITVLARFF